MKALEAAGGVVLSSPVAPAPKGVGEARWLRAIVEMETSLAQAEAALAHAVGEQRRASMREAMIDASGNGDPNLLLAGNTETPVSAAPGASEPNWVPEEIAALHSAAIRLVDSLPADTTEEALVACEELVDGCRNATTTSAAAVALESLRLRVDAERERSESRRATAQAIEELEAMLDDVEDESETAALRERLAAIDLDAGLPASLADEVEQFVRAAAMRRDDAFVLEQARAALEAIGYEVGEDFTTATTAGGAVLGLPGRDRHGVRVRQRSGQLLFNVVRFDPSGGHDAHDDTSAEDSFCDDFARFRTTLEDSGVEIEMTIAQAAGERPVEVIATTPPGADAAARPRTRSRRLARRRER